MKHDYNIIVIGAGSAGLVSSYVGAEVFNAKVALIEKHRMGGDCLNTGCVPSKALIRSASVVSMLKRHKDFGLKNATVDIDFSEVMERVHRVIAKVEPHDSVERYSALGVDCIQGDAFIRSPNEVVVDGEVHTTRSIIVATGAAPVIPAIPGLDQIEILHTDNVWELREQPRRLIVLGGGPIGSELGQCFARLGTEVTMVDRAAHILVREDDEIIDRLSARFVEEGINLRTNCNPIEIKSDNGRKVMVVECDGARDEIEFDALFVGVGRRPNVKGFGLEELGVTLTDRGAIKSDAYGRTSVRNIYTCGDCTSPYQFTHMAAHAAGYCAFNALFSPFKKFKIDLSIVPWCTYTDPEIARVGLNEKDAERQGIAYEVTTFPVDDLDRAIADEEDYGLVKVLTVPGKDRILGVTICAYHAGDLLPEFVFAMTHGLGLKKIQGTIHVYPTMGEANRFVAGEWRKNHKPDGLLRLVAKFNEWRR